MSEDPGIPGIEVKPGAGPQAPVEIQYLTEAEYEAAFEAWAATLTPGETMVQPPEFLWRRPPMRSLPEDMLPPAAEEPGQPPICPPAPQWYVDFGRRERDGRAWYALGVIEVDGTEREERYHPAANTKLHALLERYLTETEGAI